MQNNIFKKETILNDISGKLELHHQFFSKKYFELLYQSIKWKEETISLFGKTYLQPRLLSFMGDKNICYIYSKKKYEASKWNPLVLEVKERIELFTKEKFNSCLCNLYRNGNDSMGMHSDNEPELGKNPIIASASFGATRKFKYRNEVISDFINLEDSSLLIMSGAFQHNFKHGIDKVKNAGARINLTFRKIL